MEEKIPRQFLTEEKEKVSRDDESHEDSLQCFSGFRCELLLSISVELDE